MSAAYQAATEFQFSQWAKIWTNRRPGNFVHWPSTDAEAKALRESGKDIIKIALSATSQEHPPTLPGLFVALGIRCLIPLADRAV